MFITPVSMAIELKQLYDLYQELEKLGYSKDGYLSNFKSSTIYTYSNEINNRFSSWREDNTLFQKSTHLKEYNVKLFLALAAMTDEKDGIAGEYWMCNRSIGALSSFTEGKLYKAARPVDKTFALIDNTFNPNGNCRSNHRHFRKATKEEIIKYFSNNKQTNTMTKQYLTAGQLRKLYQNNACSTYRNAIITILDKSGNTFSSDDIKVEIPEEYIKQLITDGSSSQKDEVEVLGIKLFTDNNAFVKEFYNSDIPELSVVSQKLFGNTGTLTMAVESARSLGLSRKSFLVYKKDVKLHKIDAGVTIIEITNK